MLKIAPQPYFNQPKSSISEKSINQLSGALSSAINNSSLGESQNGGVNTSNIINSIRDKFQKKIDNQKEKTAELEAKKEALSILQTTSANLSSAIQNISSNNSSNYSNLSATGVPNGVTIQPSAGANVGTHSIAVKTASKQTIEIQSKDTAGNPIPFARGAVVTGGGGFGIAGLFRIYSDSNNGTQIGADASTTIAAGDTLASIAARINADPALSAVLTAFVVSDPITTPPTPNSGDKLVLQSINAGTVGNFYIGNQYITGSVGGSAIISLSVSTEDKDVQSIDIYTHGGNTFTSATAAFAAGDESGTFQPGIWNIGKGTVDILALGFGASLTTVATYINSCKNVTGVEALIVPVAGGGVTLRVQALPGNLLNYTPASLSTIFGSGVAATAQQVRPTAAIDGSLSIDGFTQNIGGSSTIADPTTDIASITVSSPVAPTTFSITQDVTSLTSSITNVVNAINDAQQFIAQQQQEEAPLLSNNALYSLQNLISTFVGSSTNTMSLSTMGITWTDYTPSSKEKREGNVPAQYLQINTTTLQNMITSNFAAVEGFFSGTFNNAAGIAAGNLLGAQSTSAKATVSSMSQILTMPSFDLKVQCTALAVGTTPPTFIAQALNYGGGGPINLTVQYLGGTSLLITGTDPITKLSTIFSGLSINYTYTDAGGLAGFLGLGGVGDTISGIQIYNGAALSLSTSLSAYLNQYGMVNQSITDINGKVERSQKTTIKTIETRDKKIAQAQAQIQRIKIAQAMAKQMQKLFNHGKD